MSKRSLIIVMVVVISIIGVVIVASNIINKKIEDVIVNVLNDEMDRNPFTYQEVSVSVTKGIFTMSGVEYVDEDIIMSMESIDLELPMSNVINNIKDLDKLTMTDLIIYINDMEISDRIGSVKIEQHHLSAHIKGSVNTKVFGEDYDSNDSDFIIEYIQMKSDDLTLYSELGEMFFSNLNMELVGNLEVSDLEKDYEKIVSKYLKDSIDEIYINCEGFEYIAKQQIKQGLVMMSYMFLGDVSFIGNQENWVIDNLSLQAGIVEDTITIDHLDLINNWIDLKVNASLTVDEALESLTPLNIRFDLNNYINDIRPMLEMFTANLTNESLPEGSFSLSFSLEDGQSYPKVSVEKN